MLRNKYDEVWLYTFTKCKNILYLIVLMQSKVKTSHEKTIDFFRTVEAGDIALMKIFKESIAVFGYTKVGKTTSCHLLSNQSPLKAENKHNDLIYKATTYKFNNATIGTTNESQT